MTKASWRSLKQMLAKIKNQDLENSNPKCSQQETGIWRFQHKNYLILS